MGYWTYFLPIAPWMWAYMLQISEYESGSFIKWLMSFPNLLKVRQRQTLDLTARAKLTLIISYALWAIGWLVGILVTAYGQIVVGIAAILLAPIGEILLLVLANLVLGSLVVGPIEKREIDRATEKLSGMSATSIAVLGSYGKTTMKEILHTVLSQGKKAVATPGNKNVLISHARWVNKDLAGDEEVLIFEYGEDRPGDIKTLAGFSKPSIAIITGLAPAHMENYGTLDAVARDFGTVQSPEAPIKVFVSGESSELAARLHGFIPYSRASIEEWKIKLNESSLSGLKFTMERPGRKLNLHSGLIGEHLIGPLALAVHIACLLGLSETEIINGVAHTKPFEHRMQPYQLGGAWVIDDTYNGNLEGMKAGLRLLKSLPAKRRIYVTPGLVEQGDLKQAVHHELGEAIVAANPDKVVLMKNSTTEYIVNGLEEAGYSGGMEIVTEPLAFYANLEHFVAAGDLVMMQNDWPDNYR